MIMKDKKNLIMAAEALAILVILGILLFSGNKTKLSPNGLEGPYSGEVEPLTKAETSLITNGTRRKERKNAIQSDGSMAPMMDVVTTDDSLSEHILRTPSRDLTLEDIGSDAFKILTARMLATVNAPGEEGVGIAAPQVGLNRRVILVQRFDKDGAPFETYANIRLEKLSGNPKSGQEGCLSVPPKKGNVYRWPVVTISYIDPESLKPVHETISGYTSVIFQHECDHLDGRLYIDKASGISIDQKWQAQLDSLGKVVGEGKK